MGEGGGLKLLLDENLSRRLVPLLQEAFPETTQVALIGLERANDRTVWETAKRDGYTVVTRDGDFLSLLSMLGYPPKIIFNGDGQLYKSTGRGRVAGCASRD